MKQLLIIAGTLFSLFVNGQSNKTAVSQYKQTPSGNEVPASVLTGEGKVWTITTVSTIGYVNTTPGSNYNSYKSGGGMIVTFKFLPNNRFEFSLYVQANSYGIDTETWTEVKGSVSFSTDANGQQVFTTNAEKGNYRVIKNGVTTTRPINSGELKQQHSNSYLWERTELKDDPANTYLLLVDLDAHPGAHPGANIHQAGSIDPAWVSKFHVPKQAIVR